MTEVDAGDGDSGGGSGGGSGGRRWLSWGFGLAALALALALALYAAYEPDRDPEELRERYAYPDSRFVTVDGLDVHYRDVGPDDPDVPVLVCLHGMFSTLHVWEGWTDELSDDLRVISLDLPGFGLTGPHPAGRNGTGETAEFLATFLDELGIDRAAVAGNSRGGEVAWRFAVDHPDRVERLVLVDSAGYRVEDAPWFYALPEVEPLFRALRYFTPRALVWYGARSAYADPARIPPGAVVRYHELLLGEGNRAAMVGMDLPPSGERSDDVSRVEAPTLVQWGAEDEWIPLEHGERFASEIPAAELVVYDGVGHVPMEATPARSAADVREFLLE